MSAPALRRVERTGVEVLPVIDADVHPRVSPADPEFQALLPQRWRDYLGLIGMRTTDAEMQIPRHRPFVSRTDAAPPGGGAPGEDPAFAAEQLLDAYRIHVGVLNNISAINWARGTASYPVELQFEFARALNDLHHERWLAADPRWRASINVAWEFPDRAVAEIERCRARSDRYVQVLLESRAEAPIGNPRYWPLFEACEALGLPVAFHVGANKRMTASGTPSLYFEDHVDFGLRNFNILSSLIFEGVFDRFPRLRIALVELGWSWAVPYAWRLDASWRALRAEVPDLSRKPSEYVRDHFWYTTQPAEEPERRGQFAEVLGMFDDFGLADKLMFSSDYPHWDFDAPDESVPFTLPEPRRRELLAGNAAALYGFDAAGEAAGNAAGITGNAAAGNAAVDAGNGAAGNAAGDAGNAAGKAVENTAGNGAGRAAGGAR